MTHHDDEPYFKPIGTVLVLAGLLLLIATIGGSIGYLYAGLADELTKIEAAGPVELDLPEDRDLIITRDAMLSQADETLMFSAQTPATVTITSARQAGWLEIDSQKQDILARLRVHHDRPVTIATAANAYPLVVRHDPIAFAKRTLGFAAIGGTLALATIAFGVYVMIRHVNARARHRGAMLHELTGIGPVR